MSGHTRSHVSLPRQLGGLPGEQVQRPLVPRPAIELRNGHREFRIGRHRAEQGHRGMKFLVVGAAEDLQDGPTLDSVDERGTLPEPGSKDTMPEIGDGLCARGDGQTLRHRTVPKSGKLGKDEPHPVALLPTATESSRTSG